MAARPAWALCLCALRRSSWPRRAAALARLLWPPSDWDLERLLALLVLLRRREDPLDDALASWGLTPLRRGTTGVTQSHLRPSIQPEEHCIPQKGVFSAMLCRYKLWNLHSILLTLLAPAFQL